MGCNLLERLAIKKDINIHSTYYKTTPTIIAKNITYTHINLISDDLNELFHGKDIVFHFANRLSTYSILQKFPNGPIIDNTLLNMKVLQAVLETKVKHFVWLSSITGYSPNENLDETKYFNGDLMGLYKGVGWMSRYYEKVLEFFSNTNNINVLVLRPTSIYGKYDDFKFESCHSLPAIIRKVVERQSPITIYGSGEDYKDWVYAEDVINFCINHYKKIKGYEVYNIGSGTTISLNRIAKLVCELDDYKDYIINHTDPNEMGKSQSLNIKKITKEHCYKSKFDIITGLTKTIQWYRKNKDI